MKIYQAIMALIVFTVCSALHSEILAQESGNIKLTVDDNPLSLAMEKTNNHDQVYFSVGQRLRYKTRSSKDFNKGRIASITDSTIAFEGSKKENITIFQKDISALAIPRNNLGPILMGAGFVFVITGVSPKSGYAARDISDAYLVIGSSLIIGGLTLALEPKYVKPGKQWALKTTSAIIPGNILTIKLMNGEVVKIEVANVKQEVITGTQTLIVDSEKARVSRRILIKDIIECSRNAN